MKNKTILQQFTHKTGQIAVLIDPEKTNRINDLKALIKKCEFAKIDYFFVGGSTVTRKEIETTVSFLKSNSTIPVVIFPGSGQQLSSETDALLYLSLLSGRNPDFLIGHHIASAQEVANMNIEVIPTAYILIDGGTQSSVAYVSQTTPIPHHQTKIAVNTALAGKLQGKQIVFFDAGSGAKQCISKELITQTKKATQLPIIVGGGIKNKENITELSEANVMVIGNKIEEDIEFLLELREFKIGV